MVDLRVFWFATMSKRGSFNSFDLKLENPFVIAKHVSANAIAVSLIGGVFLDVI